MKKVLTAAFVIIVAWMAVEALRPKRVDAVFYPSADDLTVFVREFDVGSVDACRSWARTQAAMREIPAGWDYECGVHPVDTLGDLIVYKKTVQ